MMGDLRRHGVDDERILSAMRQIPRHKFIPADFLGADAYADHPCAIGHGQTISQPFIVAHMTRLLDVQPHHRVLEIGTGSGYQTAVLATLAKHVYSLERIAGLFEHARSALSQLGYSNVSLRLADGHSGWAQEAPFDRIMVTCAPANLPRTLAEQLTEGGRLVVPSGTGVQRLFVVTREKGTFHHKGNEYVRFVPMLPGTE